jgi:hypothetical protein
VLAQVHLLVTARTSAFHFRTEPARRRIAGQLGVPTLEGPAPGGSSCGSLRSSATANQDTFAVQTDIASVRALNVARTTLRSACSGRYA